MEIMHALLPSSPVALVVAWMSTVLGGVLLIGIAASLVPANRAEPPPASIDEHRAHAEAAPAGHSHTA